MTSVSYQNGLTTISEGAFQYCSSLTSVTFPSSLTTIGEEVFEHCYKLNRITWESWNGSFDSLNVLAFYGVQDGGTVTVTEPIDPNHGSNALLEYLKTNGGLPDTWGAA